MQRTWQTVSRFRLAKDLCMFKQYKNQKKQDIESKKLPQMPEHAARQASTHTFILSRIKRAKDNIWALLEGVMLSSHKQTYIYLHTHTLTHTHCIAKFLVLFRHFIVDKFPSSLRSCSTPCRRCAKVTVLPGAMTSSTKTQT